jgi:hypothetical protein
MKQSVLIVLFVLIALNSVYADKLVCNGSYNLSGIEIGHGITVSYTPKTNTVATIKSEDALHQWTSTGKWVMREAADDVLWLDLPDKEIQKLKRPSDNDVDYVELRINRFTGQFELIMDFSGLPITTKGDCRAPEDRKF